MPKLDNWISAETLIQKLVTVVSRGGNYLLNIGPDALGTVPQPSTDRLRKIGEWLKVNGESIYGTRIGPIQGLDWCRTTRKDGVVYLHVLDWPSTGVLEIPELRIESAHLLSDSSISLTIHQQDGGITTIHGPSDPPDPIDTVVVMSLSQ